MARPDGFGCQLCLVLNLVWSLAGVLAGVTAFAVCLWHYGNTHAAVWALISGTFAATCLHLNVLCVRNKLHQWYSAETLSETSLLGVIALLIGLGGLAWYTFYATYEKIPLLPVEKSAYFTAIWAFLTALWGFTLIICSKVYCSRASDELQENSPLLHSKA